MQSLSHRVKIFVYRYSDSTPQYLLLRGDQGIEGFWGPVHGMVGHGEKLETAIRREVMDDTGLGLPVELRDLHLTKRWVLGDEEVIEWHYGFQTLSSDAQLQLGPRFADFRWDGFTSAYPSLELEHDRVAIMRLHTMLNDN